MIVRTLIADLAQYDEEATVAVQGENLIVEDVDNVRTFIINLDYQD